MNRRMLLSRAMALLALPLAKLIPEIAPPEPDVPLWIVLQRDHAPLWRAIHSFPLPRPFDHVNWLCVDPRQMTVATGLRVVGPTYPRDIDIEIPIGDLQNVEQVQRRLKDAIYRSTVRFQ